MGQHTEKGYVARDYETIRASLRKRAVQPELLGSEADVTTPGQPVPFVIDMLSEQVALCEGDFAEATRALDLRTSTGTLLEANAGLLGEGAIDAAPSFLPAYATGVALTNIGGRVVRFEPNGTQWRVPENTKINVFGEMYFELENSEDGPLLAPVSSADQWTILQPVNGWLTVESVGSTRLGRLEETNAELRTRLNLGPKGESTEPGIIAAAAALTGEGRIRFYNNRDSAVDPITGVKGKYAELLIDGASDAAVARMIYNYYCGDTGMQGNTRTHILPEDFTAYYSRPEARRAFVRIILHTGDAEDDLPLEYVDIVRAAVGQRARTLKPSKDLYESAFVGAIVSALPDSTTSKIQVQFRWSTADFWTGPSLAVGIRERVDIYGGPSPAILEGSAAGPFDVPAGGILALSVNGGAEFFVIFAVELLGALASEVAALITAADGTEGIIAGYRNGRLVLQTVLLGPTASLSVTASSSPEVLLALGFIGGQTSIGFLSDVTVEETA